MAAYTEFWEYVTQDGDRWDTIAYAYYGDATLYEPIISANPDVAITPILESGIKIIVPDITVDAADSTDDLPPWKQ